VTTTEAITPADNARTAAEAVRSLNHTTLSTSAAGWEYPSDAYDVVGALDEMAMRLPQALDQVAKLVERLAAHDHISSDRGGDGAEDVHTALRGLEWARADAEQLHSRLSAVHSALSPLAWKE
jgi:hypothetical protein